ncbi:hypothetical protein [Pseudooceanicola aestuarii]|uniref:hypothetical protein n=1 Tax=Pseudooceanicola aestuarii TaxID=2697319 RepID=UPI0013D566A0|nr:hypothetical protein [Pseudooceanicola aestuarii]
MLIQGAEGPFFVQILMQRRTSFSVFWPHYTCPMKVPLERWAKARQHLGKIEAARMTRHQVGTSERRRIVSGQFEGKAQ